MNSADYNLIRDFALIGLGGSVIAWYSASGDYEMAVLLMLFGLLLSQGPLGDFS